MEVSCTFGFLLYSLSSLLSLSFQSFAVMKEVLVCAIYKPCTPGKVQKYSRFSVCLVYVYKYSIILSLTIEDQTTGEAVVLSADWFATSNRTF